MPNKRQTSNQAQEDTGAGTPPTDANARAADESAPAAAENAEAQPTSNGKSAAPSLSGLRGADYVQALTGQPLTTVDVPLLPNERRGDWTRARGLKIRVTSRQLSTSEGAGSAWLEGAHALAALVIELQRPGATRYDQVDLKGSAAKEAIERLSDFVNQARLRAQAQTGKKWTASHVYLIPVEDA